MARIRRKLYSAAGASMLLGLLFLLFCLTVGAVVLTAASVGAGRTQRNRQVQQNYLAVQSAANLLMDSFEDMEFTGTYLYRFYTEYHSYMDENGVSHTRVSTYSKDELDAEHTVLTKTNDGFQKQMKNYFISLFRSSPALKGYQTEAILAPPAQNVPLTVLEKESTTGTLYDFPSVKIDLTLGDPQTQGYSEEGYTVTAVISLAEPAAEGDHKMTLVFTPEVEDAIGHKHEDGNPRIDTTIITSRVTWKSAAVTKGAAE